MFPYLVSLRCNFNMRRLLLLGQCHVIFLFLVQLYKNYKIFVLENLLFRQRFESLMAAVMLQLKPSFHTNCSKNSLFGSTNTYEQNIVCEQSCIAHHEDKMLFLSNRRYHILLIGDIKELLQKLNEARFNCHHMDCQYTLFAYQFSGKIVVKRGQLFDKVQRALHINHQNRGVERSPSIAEKKWRKSTRNICWAPSKRQNRRKLVSQSRQTELNELKKLKSFWNW